MNNEQIERLIKHFETEVEELSDPMLELETGEKWADNQRLALDAMRELKIERAKVARLEAMVEAQDEVIRDERQAHEAKIARLSGELDDARNELIVMAKDIEDENKRLKTEIANWEQVAD
jgi:hypothetical protein